MLANPAKMSTLSKPLHNLALVNTKGDEAITRNLYLTSKYQPVETTPGVDEPALR